MCECSRHMPVAKPGIEHCFYARLDCLSRTEQDQTHPVSRETTFKEERQKEEKLQGGWRAKTPQTGSKQDPKGNNGKNDSLVRDLQPKLRKLCFCLVRNC